MSETEELKLLDALAKKDGYPNWKDYMKKHTAVFYPVGVNTLVHSFARIAVNAISLARKEGKQDAFGMSTIMLKDWIDRIRKQNDIDWNDGTYVLKQHRKSMKAFPVPESMLEKFEIDLEVMEEHSNNLLKDVEARVREEERKCKFCKNNGLSICLDCQTNMKQDVEARVRLETMKAEIRRTRQLINAYIKTYTLGLENPLTDVDKMETTRAKLRVLVSFQKEYEKESIVILSESEKAGVSDLTSSTAEKMNKEKNPASNGSEKGDGK